MLDLGLHDQPVLGSALRWRRPDEHGLLFNMRNSEAGTRFDTACLAKLIPLAHSQDLAYHLVRLEPYTSFYVPPSGSPEDGVSIVHHMDLYVCDETMTHAPDDPNCISNTWLNDSGPCYAMIWAYDKGALAPHALPTDAGFRLGKGTRFRSILLQIHYQLPDEPIASGGGGGGRLLTAEELVRNGYHDSSGVRATFTHTLRPHNAWSFEFMPHNMAIPAGATNYEYANRLPADKLVEILGADLRFSADGQLHLRQIHAHAHRHATRVALSRTRAGRTETLFAIDGYCGYGECQHFHNIEHADPTVRAGDMLEFRCTYDNHEGVALRYGLSAMNEMCGPILLYTPHDHALPPHKYWYKSIDGLVRSSTVPGAGAGAADQWVRSPFKHVDRSQDVPARVLSHPSS